MKKTVCGENLWCGVEGGVEHGTYLLVAWRVGAKSGFIDDGGVAAGGKAADDREWSDGGQGCNGSHGISPPLSTVESCS